MKLDFISYKDQIYLEDDFRPVNVFFMSKGKSYRLHIDDTFIDLHETFEDEDDILIKSINLQE